MEFVIIMYLFLLFGTSINFFLMAYAKNNSLIITFYQNSFFQFFPEKAGGYLL